jgi:hypothetical protein
MESEYLKRLSSSNINQYISDIIGRVYSILPLYETHGKTIILDNKIDGLYRNIDGFLCVYNQIYHSESHISLDIISYISELRFANKHKEVRLCVLKICSLLDSLKVGDDTC